MLLGLLWSKSSLFTSYPNAPFFFRLFAILKRKRQRSASLTLFPAWCLLWMFLQLPTQTKQQGKGQVPPTCYIPARYIQPAPTPRVSSHQLQAGSKRCWEPNTLLRASCRWPLRGQTMLFLHCFPTRAGPELHTICMHSEKPRLSLESWWEVSIELCPGTQAQEVNFSSPSLGQLCDKSV